MADEHDVIVIGMGVGGEEVAGRCADGGMNVLAIERKLVGGECPYWGCIPSKMMMRAGRAADRRNLGCRVLDEPGGRRDRGGAALDDRVGGGSDRSRVRSGLPPLRKRGHLRRGGGP